jgi:ATP-dependent DNA helicase RecG
MTDAEIEAKLSELLALPSETEWVEFKHSNSDPQQIGEYLSALSNAAALCNQPFGYMAWGIEDGSHHIVGTTFRPRHQKAVGNEDLEPWLTQNLYPRIDFAIHEWNDFGKRVVLFVIPAANRVPVRFKDTEYIRVGNHKKRLRDHEEKERKLWAKFSTAPFVAGLVLEGVSDDIVLERLDYSAYFSKTKQRLPGTKSGILDLLAADSLLVRRGTHLCDVTALGAILFARDLTQFGRLGRKAIRIIKYHGNSRLSTEREWNEPAMKQGYASVYEAAISFINSILPKNEPIIDALRRDVRVYPEIAIRELVANTLIHQDLSITGAGPMIEIFDDRMEFTNPGEPLMDPQRFIDMPPRSRNEELAGFMRRLNICEERGSGIDKVIHEIEMYQLPAPDFRQLPDSTKAILFAPRPHGSMNAEQRIRACYQHCVLCYVGHELMTNTTLRKRLAISDVNYTMASRVIKSTIDAGLIKILDPKAGFRLRQYVPYWA